MKINNKFFLKASVVLFTLFLFTNASSVNAAVLYSDDFTNSDDTPLTTHNTNWTDTSNGSTIQNNELSTTNSTINYLNSFTSTTDQCVSFDVEFPLANIFYIYTRYDPATGAGFQSYLNPADDTFGIYLVDSSENVSFLANDVYTPPTSGVHTVKQCTVGSTTTLYIDNSSLGSGESSQNASGTSAVRPYINEIDNFQFETVGSESSVVISASPSSGAKLIDNAFSVNITVNSDDSAFNAARSTVAVSSNLTINSISAPTSNPCNMQYTQNPSTSNPSFAGAIYGSSSESCNVYTMILTPNDEGTGTITFTDGSVKSYADNSEIMTGVTNASFTLTDGPTPTPTAMLEFSVTSPYETYKENFIITGTKLDTITAMFLNGSDDDSEYPTSTSWEIPVTLSLGENNYTLYGTDGTNQTATQNIIVDRHTLGDINGDGEIDLIDASLFAVDWDKTEDLTYVLSDMNDDGVVDLTDLSILAKLQE